MDTTKLDKALGEPLRTLLQSKGTLFGYQDPGRAQLSAGPADGAVFFFSGDYSLSVHELSADDLAGTRLKKAYGLRIASSDADLVSALVDGTGSSLKSITLWPSAHPDAHALLDTCSKKLSMLELHPPHLSALDRVRYVENLILDGASEAQVVTAFQIPGLKRLTLQGSLPTAAILAHATPKQLVQGPSFWLDKVHLRIPVDAVASLVDATLPKSLKALQVVGPGTVDAAALAPLAAQVEVLELDGVTLDGPLAAVAHEKLVALRLRDGVLSDVDGLAKHKKLHVVDLTGTEATPALPATTRVLRRTPDAAQTPLPATDAFVALAQAPAAARARVLLAWGSQLARDYHTLLAFEPSQQGPAKKLLRVDRKTHWVERLWEALAPMYNIIDEYRTVVRRTDHRSAIQTLAQEAYALLHSLDRTWMRDEQDPAWLERLAGYVASAAWAARTWHDEGPCEQGVDATGVIEALGSIATSDQPLPFPELEGMGFDDACLLATKWCCRALTSVLLELPARPAKKLRALRNRAWQGDVGALMAESPGALRGSDRADALAQAILDVGANLQAGEPAAMRTLARQLRALYDGDGEAMAQQLDRRNNRHRIQWAEIDQEPRYVAWARAVAPNATTAPDLSDTMKLPAPPVLGRADDAWGQQLALWIDLLRSGRAGQERTGIALVVGHHMAEWVGGNPFAAMPPYIEWEDRVGDVHLSDDLPRHLEWDVVDPLCDAWGVRLLDVLLETHDDPALRAARDHAMAGSTNRMATRWPSMNGIHEPVADFWIRAYQALDPLCAAHPDDEALALSRQAFQEVAHGGLDPDDDQTWLSALPTVLHRVGGVPWETLDADLAAALR